MLLIPITTKYAEEKASDNFHLPTLSPVCICARNKLWGEGKGEGCLGEYQHNDMEGNIKKKLQKIQISVQ